MNQPAWKRIRVIVDVDVEAINRHGDLHTMTPEEAAQKMVAAMIQTAGSTSTYWCGSVVMHEPRVESNRDEWFVNRN